MYQLNKVSVNLGGHQILKAIDLTINQSEVTGVIGVSGSGKTTLLHTLAGLLELSKGTITPAIKPTDVAIVMQEHGLFPWKTARQNIELGRINQASDDVLLNQIIRDLNIETLLERYPHQLSGGQSQRVAIARALYKMPKLILMDEPTAALDEVNRMKLAQLLKKVQAQYQMTIVYVTHQLQEVVELSNQIIVLNRGEIIKCFDAAQIMDNQQLLSDIRVLLLSSLDEVEGGERV